MRIEVLDFKIIMLIGQTYQEIITEYFLGEESFWF